MGGSAQKRDTKLDFMRALGTLTIIVPHVSSPDIMVQIRTFDVVMLVLISGMSYAYQMADGYLLEYGQYVKKRFSKLVFPTYFLIFIVYFSMNVISVALSKGIYYDITDLLKSLFLFEDGIGYVWIIKVYLGMALLAPFIWKVVKQIDNDILFFCLCGAIYLVYRSIWLLSQQVRLPILSVVLDEYVFYIIAYMIPFAVGLYFCKHKNKKKVSMLFLLLFLGIQLYVIIQGGGFEPNLYKYPPEIYYLSYGIACSVIIYGVAPTKTNKIIKWLSKNSLSFYLTHVFWVIWLSTIANSLHITVINLFWVKYILVVILTTATVVVIQKIQTCYKRNKKLK